MQVISRLVHAELASSAVLPGKGCQQSEDGHGFLRAVPCGE